MNTVVNWIVSRIPALRAACSVTAALLLWGCGATFIGADLAPDPYGWEGAGRVIRHDFRPLSRDLARGLDLATQGEVYFGAIHVNRNTNKYFYARDWNTLAAALDITQEECEAESAPGTCVLLATVVPARLDPGNSAPEGFSVSTLNQFRLIYRFQHDRRGQWGAFAKASLSASGIALDQASRKAAEDLAQANCKAAVAAEIERFSAAARQLAHARGYDRCRVVDVVGPLTPPRN